MTTRPSTQHSSEADSSGAAPTGRANRRRGAALTEAIYRAAFEQLAEGGFDALAFDKLAPRAGTGKSVLYRRWSTPAELLLAALADPVVGFGRYHDPDTGSLRGDLLFLLEGLARIFDEPRGRALHPLMAQRNRPPELYVRVKELVILPNQQILLGRLRAAVERGEADPACVTPLVASVGPRMVFAESMDTGPVSRDKVLAIVDDVLLPLTAPRSPAPQPSP